MGHSYPIRDLQPHSFVPSKVLAGISRLQENSKKVALQDPGTINKKINLKISKESTEVLIRETMQRLFQEGEAK
jgi:hypothetical protein